MNPHANNNNTNSSQNNNDIDDFEMSMNEFDFLFNPFDGNQDFGLNPNSTCRVESAASSSPPPSVGPSLSVSPPSSVGPSFSMSPPPWFGPSLSVSPPPSAGPSFFMSPPSSVPSSPSKKNNKPEKGTPEYEIQRQKGKEAAARHLLKRKREKIEKEELFKAIKDENRELNKKLARTKQIYDMLDQYLISIDYYNIL